MPCSGTGPRSATGPAIGPRTLPELRRILAEVRRRGHALEDGEITPGFASVAAAVHDHSGYPVAGVAVTFPADARVEPERLAGAVRATAAELTSRIAGHPPLG